MQFEPVTPQEWVETLAPAQAWEIAYPMVHQLAIAWLNTKPLSQEFTTHELAEALFPVKSAKSPEEVAARKRMFRALLIEPKEPFMLDPYRARGAARPMYVRGKKVMANPWVWRNVAGGGNG